MGILAFLSDNEVEKTGSVVYAIDAILCIQGSCSYTIRGVSDFRGTLQYSICDTLLDINQSLSYAGSRDFRGTVECSSPQTLQVIGCLSYNIFQDTLTKTGNVSESSSRDIMGNSQVSGKGNVICSGGLSYSIYEGYLSQSGNVSQASQRDMGGSVSLTIGGYLDVRGSISVSIWEGDLCSSGSVSLSASRDIQGDIQLSGKSLFNAPGNTQYNILNTELSLKGDTQWDILGVNPVEASGRVSVSADDATAPMFDTTLKTSVNASPVAFSQLSLSIDKESYCWAFTAIAEAWGTYSDMQPGSILSVQIGLNTPQLFVIDERKKVKLPYGEMSYSFSGRSTTALMGSGNAITISNTWENCLVSEIITELTSGFPVGVEVRIEDWLLPEFSVDSQYPIDALHTLAQITGAYLTTRDNVLVIDYKYPKSPMTIDTWAVDHDITTQDTILSVSDYIMVGDDYTEVFVSDYQDTSDIVFSLHEIRRLSAQSCIVSLVSYPDVGEDVARNIIASSHDPARVSLVFQSTVLDTITETVEIINGFGSVSGIIESIVNTDYEHNADLGVVTGQNNKISTLIKAHSLLTITYVTKSYRFLLESIDDKIQLIVEI